MAARNCLAFGLPENLVDVVSFSYHVNHEIIGRVEVKSEWQCAQQSTHGIAERA
jgi:hypothetical protein